MACIIVALHTLVYMYMYSRLLNFDLDTIRKYFSISNLVLSQKFVSAILLLLNHILNVNAQGLLHTQFSCTANIAYKPKGGQQVPFQKEVFIFVILLGENDSKKQIIICLPIFVFYAYS